MTSPTETEKTLMSLVRAKDENVVEKILEDKFFADAIWKPVGGSDNNYAIISNQQTDSTNALCEKPINSIDHVLLKQCKLKDGDPEGPKAPKNMKDAVKKSYELASKGDIALLSPACASFDRFKNYEERGWKFKKAVREL